MAAYYWVDTVARGGIPTTALHGGVDIDGHQIYVGRAFHDGDWIPAKVIPGKHVAYVAYNGEEIGVDNFQVLCEQRFDWVPTNGGDIPPGAVEGGRTSDGEPLFIGRVEHEGSQTVGKVHPSHGVLYIPFDGKELAYPNYEILVLRP
ncbi:natterin-4-like [Anoplophora glabripennis]|uniref:natterin-4-like n=1 Tax=Anoplophora glabripennis TaxID=217634 RepID=UPI000C763B04|nr:natterin-4-like [Anoplophora glabripennis]